MSIWREHNLGLWRASTYGEAYDKACDTTDPVYYEEDGQWVKLKRPQAPSLSIKGGKLRKTEKADV